MSKNGKLISKIEKSPKDDHIYYNVNLYNDTNEKIYARFQEFRSSAIIDSPKDYHLSIVRFQVPARNIPIFIFEEDGYNVTLSYGGDDFTETVVYVPNNTIEPNNMTVRTYQAFLDMINTAFSAAFTALKVAHAGAPPTIAPYLIFNAETKLFSLIVEDLYDPVYAMAATIEIYMNYKLFHFFQTFPSIFMGYNNAKDFQIIAEDTHNNFNSFPGFPPVMGVDLLQITQELESIGLWNDLTGLVFTTMNIPVKPEYIPNLERQGTSSSNNNIRILTDFEPDRSGTSGEPTSALSYQFYPQGPYRFIDMLGEQPLQTLDCQVYWRSKNQTLHPLRIDPGDVFTLKMLLQRKGCYESNDDV